MTASDSYDAHDYPPFAVTADIAVFTVAADQLQVVLVERGRRPFEGRWALPGGFVRPEEDVDAAAVRELEEETGLTSPAGRLRQFGAYGAVDRDPRMRVVTVAFWAIVPDLDEPAGGTDASRAFLVPVVKALAVPENLAFDHHQILTDARDGARRALERTTVAVGFCPPRFTISELRGVYEAVWDVPLDPGNFQKRVVDTPGFVEPTGDRRRGRRGRPPELYRAGAGVLIHPPFRRPERGSFLE